jgi:hypothetical protein
LRLLLKSITAGRGRSACIELLGVLTFELLGLLTFELLGVLTFELLGVLTFELLGLLIVELGLPLEREAVPGARRLWAATTVPSLRVYSRTWTGFDEELFAEPAKPSNANSSSKTTSSLIIDAIGRSSAELYDFFDNPNQPIRRCLAA